MRDLNLNDLIALFKLCQVAKKKDDISVEAFKVMLAKRFPTYKQEEGLILHCSCFLDKYAISDEDVVVLTDHILLKEDLRNKLSYNTTHIDHSGSVNPVPSFVMQIGEAKQGIFLSSAFFYLDKPHNECKEGLTTTELLDHLLELIPKLVSVKANQDQVVMGGPTICVCGRVELKSRWRLLLKTLYSLHEEACDITFKDFTLVFKNVFSDHLEINENEFGEFQCKFWAVPDSNETLIEKADEWVISHHIVIDDTLSMNGVGPTINAAIRKAGEGSFSTEQFFEIIPAIDWIGKKINLRY